MRISYPSTVFVNIYLIDLGYGGPEEGGWYFQTGEFIDGEAFPEGKKEEIEQATERARIRCNEDNEDRNDDIHSVLSEGRYVVMIQQHPGENYPATKPHYE